MALASFCLVTISVFVIEGVPILTVPVFKYGADFKGYYGSAWYSLAAASGLSIVAWFYNREKFKGLAAINWLANSICIFSIKCKDESENKKEENEKNNFLKI